MYNYDFIGNLAIVKNKWLYNALVLFVLPLLSMNVLAEPLSKVTLDEDEYLLLSIQLDGETLRSNVDAFKVGEQTLFAIEPLFTALSLRYQLRQDSLIVWKNEVPYEYELLPNETASQQELWADDGFYQYISQNVLEQLFSVSFELNLAKLAIELTTTDYLFPVTLIEQQRQQRFKNKVYSYSANRKNREVPVVPITVPDQYHIATLPHGEIFSTVEFSDDETTHDTNLLLTSDLLYHSARVNLSKSSNSKLQGGIALSRYKTSPENRILGAFDFYSFGDISSFSAGTILEGDSGVGFTIQRSPINYRQNNTQIDIEQQAPPGWEAELFLNNRLVTSDTVPQTGLLVFTNIDIYYGRNDFEVKVYGPFGELEQYTQSYPLKANPLAAGDMAYGLYALDNQRNLLTGDNDFGEFKLDSLGGAFNYGVTDNWQVGGAFQNVFDESTDDYIQVLGLKNFLSFPGILIETDLATNDDSNYAFSTNLTGSLFGRASYQLDFETTDGIDVNSSFGISGSDRTSFGASYFDNVFGIPFQFRASHDQLPTSTSTQLTNNIYYNYKRLRFSHSLNYFNVESQVNQQTISNSNITGSLGISGSLLNNFRLSADIQYAPDDDDVILDSSRLTAQYILLDPWNLKHYFTLNYQPLSDNGNWQFVHNLAFETPDYRLSLRNRYSSSNSWSVGLNVNFFLGYDYHSNTTRTSSGISGQTASLNIHSYLDRQLNGEPDVLDYPLEGVEYYGNNNWQDIRSGKSGKVILHGATVNTPFRFGATWQNGSQTVNNDYVVYTHPGARVDVNMPFYLTTELSGFVYRQTEQGTVPVTGLSIVMFDNNGQLINQIKTDEDGYFEFLDVHPNQYTLAINKASLHDKALTADIVGYSFSTPNIGGFSELPTFFVKQQTAQDSFADERIEPLELNEENVEVLVWDDEEAKRKNYFTLPTDKQLTAEYVLPENKTSPSKPKTPTIQPTIDSGESDEVAVSDDSNKQDLLQPSFNDYATKSLLTSESTLSQFFTIQLGAFLNEDIAIEFAEGLQTRFPAELTIVELHSDTKQSAFKIFYGQFINIEEANQTAQQIGLTSNEYLVKPLPELAMTAQLAGTPISPVAEQLPTLIQSNNIVQTGSVTSPQWVIQFYASQSSVPQEQAQVFNAIGILYQAEKTSGAANEIWYCLVSQGYTSRIEAEQALAASGLNGWVNTRADYTNINVFN
jgi:hypothetical protein